MTQNLVPSSCGRSLAWSVELRGKLNPVCRGVRTGTGYGKGKTRRRPITS
jgi:hypothetical protein